ncbi:hypothetical protein HPB50_022359 [Hyalomma asiaticum]|uniref:Uncharacterized protein n=1 Tax=Hyalomma asiaticum TaxID=266040 RepID=A0ACB7S1B2_HYAAI|nr:hypothetical protein HPB50_022359 [Hyalomma asiaticum]
MRSSRESSRTHAQSCVAAAYLSPAIGPRRALLAFLPFISGPVNRRTRSGSRRGERKSARQQRRRRRRECAAAGLASLASQQGSTLVGRSFQQARRASLAAGPNSTQGGRGERGIKEGRLAQEKR